MLFFSPPHPQPRPLPLPLAPRPPCPPDTPPVSSLNAWSQLSCSPWIEYQCWWREDRFLIGAGHLESLPTNLLNLQWKNSWWRKRWRGRWRPRCHPSCPNTEISKMFVHHAQFPNTKMLLTWQIWLQQCCLRPQPGSLRGQLRHVPLAVLVHGQLEHLPLGLSVPGHDLRQQVSATIGPLYYLILAIDINWVCNWMISPRCWSSTFVILIYAMDDNACLLI